MDYDNQIKDLTTRVQATRSDFLSRSVEDSEGNIGYDLIREFEATRRNRSFRVFIILATFLLAGVGGILWVNHWTERAQSQVQVSVDQFEEISLREVLDGARRLESALASARRELQLLVEDRESEIRTLSETSQRRQDLIRETAPTPAAVQRQIAQEQAGLARALEEVDGRFSGLVQAKEAEIEAIQAELEAYDTRFVEQARQQEELLNNQNRIFERQRDELINGYESRIAELTERHSSELGSVESSYEQRIRAITGNYEARIRNLILRFNPNWNDQDYSQWLQDTAPEGFEAGGEIFPYDSVLSQDLGFGSAEHGQLAWELHRMERLLERLRTVDSVNSVPDLLEALGRAESAVRAQYRELLLTSTNELNADNQRILNQENLRDRLFWALNYYGSRIVKESGFLLDTRDPREYLVMISPLFTVAAGDQALVFRGNDLQLGTLEFLEAGSGLLRARMTQESLERQPEPFDPLLLLVERIQSLPDQENQDQSIGEENPTAPATESEVQNGEAGQDIPGQDQTVEPEPGDLSNSGALPEVEPETTLSEEDPS